MDRSHKRLLVSHFADQNDVGVLADGMLHADGEVLHVLAKLALVDQALVFGEDKLDRIFKRENVLAVVLVDVVEHGRNRRALPRARYACQQNEPLIVSAELLHPRWQVEALEIRNLVVDATGDEAERSLLLQEVHAKPPADAIDYRHMRKVAAALIREDCALTRVEHRQAESAHCLFIDALGFQWLQSALDANNRRLANLQVQVATFQPDKCLKKSIDFVWRLGDNLRGFGVS